MLPIPLVICERTGDWAEAIRRTAERLDALQSLQLVETRSIAECRSRLSERRATSAGLPICVELSLGGASDVCGLLQWHVRRFGNAPRIVVAARELVDYELAVREAGATRYVVSTRDLRSCVGDYLRFRDDPTHLPLEDERSLTERLRDSLPWKARRESV